MNPHSRSAVRSSIKARSLALQVVLAAALATGPQPALAVAEGDQAPAFVLPGEQGATVALADLRGKVVLVDFWASWCAPCRRSFPWLNEMQQKYGPRGLTVVAVNVDKKRADALRFLQQYPARFAIAFDDVGTTPAKFAVKGMPSSYLIDARGKVVAVEVGFSDERANALEDRIRSMLPSAVALW